MPNSQVAPLLALLASVIASGEDIHESQAKNRTTTPTPRKVSDFSKLRLEREELLGSRWAIEQSKSNPISVFHAIEIVDAVLIDKNQLTLRVEFYIRQRWVADGLRPPEGLFKEDDPEDVFVSTGEKVLKHMWSPASYISTSRESNMAISSAPNSVVHIFRNRTIIFKARLYTNVACTTNYAWYPLDSQECLLVVESYKYYDKYVTYEWENENTTHYRPVTQKLQRLLQYDLSSVITTKGSFARGGRAVRYPYVKVKFVFERKLANSIIQVFTPTTLVVVLSWFSFWLGLDAVPGRISLLVTCMLTLVTMHSGVKNSMMSLHYITAMDVWMVGCMAFVFASICEFVIVKYTNWRHQLKEKAKALMREDEEIMKFRAWLKRIQMSVTTLNTEIEEEEKPKPVGKHLLASQFPPQWSSQETPANKLALQTFTVKAETNAGAKLRNGSSAVTSAKVCHQDSLSESGSNCSFDPEVQQLSKKADRKPWVIIDRGSCYQNQSNTNSLEPEQDPE